MLPLNYYRPQINSANKNPSKIGKHQHRHGHRSTEDNITNDQRSTKSKQDAKQDFHNSQTQIAFYQVVKNLTRNQKKKSQNQLSDDERHKNSFITKNTPKNGNTSFTLKICRRYISISIAKKPIPCELDIEAHSGNSAPSATPLLYMGSATAGYNPPSTADLSEF